MSLRHVCNRIIIGFIQLSVLKHDSWLSLWPLPTPQEARQHHAKQVALDWQRSLSGGRLLLPQDVVSGDEVKEGVEEGPTPPELGGGGVIQVQQQAKRDR